MMKKEMVNLMMMSRIFQYDVMLGQILMMCGI